MDISSGNYKISDNGYVTAWNTEPIEFKFSENVIIQVSVLKIDNEEPSIRTKIIDNKILNVIFTNPHLVNNFGTSEPFKIGTLDGKEAYGNLRVTPLGDNSKNNYDTYQVYYSFYIKEA